MWYSDIDRLSRPLALEESAAKELDGLSKYHTIMIVKGKKSSNIISYCVSLDINHLENGKPISWGDAGNVQKIFIYAAKDKPLSVTAIDREFIKCMCGDSFYNPNK